MSEKLIYEVRPILTNWADVNGVEIQWFHAWDKDGCDAVTAFGYDANKQPQVHTVTVMRESSAKGKGAL